MTYSFPHQLVQHADVQITYADVQITYFFVKQECIFERTINSPTFAIITQQVMSKVVNLKDTPTKH